MKIPKQAYTAEFRELAVKQVKEGQATVAVARDLGLIEQTLRNWVKAFDAGNLNAPGAKKVTAEEMELSRLRAENIRLKQELSIIKKRRRTSRGMSCEVRLDCSAEGFPAGTDVRGAGGQCQRLPSLAAWRDRRTQWLTDRQMLTLIEAIHAELKGCYGSPRMVNELHRRGFPAGKARVERQMREN